MDILIFIFACFAVLGAVDTITGGHLKLGTEFEKGINLMGVIISAMLGMLCLAPVIGNLLSPVITPVCEFLHIDPSVLPAMILANDMGGAPLAKELTADQAVGYWNGVCVCAMMGVTVSFTIPTALKMIDRKHHRSVLLGLLCGISTVPVGCFVSGLIVKLPILTLLWNLLPIIIFAALIIFGLFKAPELSVKIMGVFGKIIAVIITIGLAAGIFEFLTGITLIKGMSPVKDHFEALFNIAFVLSGTFPLLKVISLILKKPLGRLADLLKINGQSVLGLITTLASSAPTFDMVRDMDKKGIVLNLAFSVSAAFVLSDHLAYALIFKEEYAFAMVVGKLSAGILSLFVANYIFDKTNTEE